MAHNQAPGRLREPPFQGLTLYHPYGWKRLFGSTARNSTTIQDTNGEGLRILGTDRDQGAIAISKRNAARVGVESQVIFRQQAICSNEWFENPSLAPIRTSHFQEHQQKGSFNFIICIATHSNLGTKS